MRIQHGILLLGLATMLGGCAAAAGATPTPDQSAAMPDETDEDFAAVREWSARGYGTLFAGRPPHPFGDERPLAATPADRNLTATVLEVRRNEYEVLATIDAGARDGVRAGWVMSIDNGSSFIGNLRIVTVHEHRSIGVVTLEEAQRGFATVGHRARARAGQ